MADYAEPNDGGRRRHRRLGGVVATAGRRGCRRATTVDTTGSGHGVARRSGTGREDDVVSIAVPVYVGADTVGTVMVSTDD